MIQDSEQLGIVVDQIKVLYLALGHLRERLLPASPEQYRLFAEGPLDEIRRMQADIDQYLQLELHRTREPDAAESVA